MHKMPGYDGASPVCYMLIAGTGGSEDVTYPQY